MGGKIIRIYKFRSMVSNAEELIAHFTPEQRREYEENFKLENDPRITKIGNFLRKSSLDELPQLLNILNGTLSIVGPRPVVPAELENMEVCRINSSAQSRDLPAIGRQMDVVRPLMMNGLRWNCIM